MRRPALQRGRAARRPDYNARFGSFVGPTHSARCGAQDSRSMEKHHKNVLVLSCCQATLQTTTVTMVAVTGLAGYALAADKSFATVPLTCYVLGSAVATIPASFLMNGIGRCGGFQIGSLT